MQRAMLGPVMAVILISSALTNATLASTVSEETPSLLLLSERKPNDLIIHANMTINLVMVGEEWSDDVKGNVTSKLIKTLTPRIFFENRTAGFTYNYTYSFTSVSDDMAGKLFEFMNSIAEEDPIPPPIEDWMEDKEAAFWGHELMTIFKKKYKLIDAFRVEDWISKNLKLGEGYTIFFLNPSLEQVDYFHTYSSITQDPDTRAMFLQQGMMGYGGTHRFYFIDLTAGPWLYPFVPVSQNQVIAQFHKNLYEVRSDEDYYKFIADYVNDAISLLFTPSYLYAPVYKSNFSIDVFLVDMTAGRAFHDVAERFVDRDTINLALTRLIPYADWSSEIVGQRFDSLPRDLQRAILSSRLSVNVPGGDVVLVKSQDLIIELNTWVNSTLTTEQQELVEEEATETVFVPVVIFVFDTEAYVDEIPVVGTAAPEPGDETIPCCAIVAVSKYALFGLRSGLSTLAIHEMGHVLGLRHPHDGYSPTKGEFNNWFFDWSDTPMSYSSPTSLGCGLPGIPCGLVVSEYSQFDHDAMDRGLIVYLLNQAHLNVYDAVVMLEEKGYGERNLPPDIVSALSDIDSDIEESVQDFAQMQYFNYASFQNRTNLMNPMDDSFDFALGAFMASGRLLEDVSSLEIAPAPEGVDTITASEPSLVDESGSELASPRMGEAVGIKAEISSNSRENVTLTYLIQVKDSSNGFTLFLSWLEGITVEPGEVTEPSIFWTSDAAGEVQIEVYVWESIENPVPLSQVKSATVEVGR